MSLSQFTAVPFIAERSEATPGLWNNVFSVLSQNVDQLNNDVVNVLPGALPATIITPASTSNRALGLKGTITSGGGSNTAISLLDAETIVAGAVGDVIRGIQVNNTYSAGTFTGVSAIALDIKDVTIASGGSTMYAITTGAGYVSHGDAMGVASGSATTAAYGFSSETSLGFYRSAASTIVMSYGTLNLAKSAVRLSMRTLAASAVTASAAKTNVAIDEVVFTIGGASGASLCVMSGGTLYFFNSAGSAAQS